MTGEGSQTSTPGKSKHSNKDEKNRENPDAHGVRRRLKYPIGSSFTLRPNMLRDYNSATSPASSKPDKPNSSALSNSVSKTSSFRSASVPAPETSKASDSTALNSSPSGTKAVRSPDPSTSRGFFFSEIPSGYFTLRRPFTRSSANSKSASQKNGTASSWSSTCFSSLKSSTSSSSGSNFGSSVSPPSPTKSADCYSKSPSHRRRSGDMSLTSTMRSMKSFSVCEENPESKEARHLVTENCTTGGVLGGVFAGIRDSMSASANSCLSATNETSANDKDEKKNSSLFKNNPNDNASTTQTASKLQLESKETKTLISNSSGSLNNNSSVNEHPETGVKCNSVLSNLKRDYSVSSSNGSRILLNNAHTISNSIDACINNVTHASSKIAGFGCQSGRRSSSSLFSSSGSAASLPSTLGISNLNQSKNSSYIKTDNRKSISTKTTAEKVEADWTEKQNGGSTTSSGASSPCEGQPMGEMIHLTSDHATCAMKAMNHLRSDRQLCDIELIVGDTSVYAHKVVLAAASPYFTAMFINDVKERTASEVILREVDPTALYLLVNYAYSGEISITEDNVQVLLPASNLLQMCSVREACCRYLLRQLHPSNCLGIRTFADAHNCEELHSRSHKYALQHFPEVCCTEEFLALSLDKMLELISSSELNVDTEERVFTAVVSWIRHELHTRKLHIASLLRHVRLPLLSRDFLTSMVDNEPLLQGQPECQTLQLEALKYHLLPEQRSSFTSERTVERKPLGYKPYVFAVGGGSLFNLHSEVESYNPRTDRWMPVAPMKNRRSRTAAASLSRHLYVMGGYDGVSDISQCEVYQPATNCWTSITAMGTKRSCHGVGTLNGLIYCVGGYDGASCLNSVERYDPLTGIWSSCPAMSCRRRHTKVAVLDQCLYAVAGFDTSNYQCSVERLDPREGKWCFASPLISRRSSLGAVGVAGVGIYCSGGSDGAVTLLSVERYNLRRNAWEPITAMHSRRTTHELVTHDGFVYAIGGNDGSASLNSMERYDPKTNRWQMMPSMLARRSSVAVAVVECYGFEKVLLGKAST
ncbi:Kelch repeat type 1 [Trinorchestia longiramus]|nr:Kelch repeat type 1 [Trinorchestia longiramus]